MSDPVLYVFYFFINPTCVFRNRSERGGRVSEQGRYAFRQDNHWRLPGRPGSLQQVRDVHLRGHVGLLWEGLGAGTQVG